jgi:PAS domain S-box-containing protein
MKVRWNGERVSTLTFGRVLVGGLIVLDLLIIALAGWTLQQARGHYVAQAEAATHNLSQVLEQNIQGTINQIDLGLLAIKDEFERNDLPEDKRRVHGHMQAQASRIRILAAIRMTDAQGTVTLDADAPTNPYINIADQDSFQHLKNHPEAGLYISAPHLGRITGKWGLHLARRLSRPDGGFAGTVYGTLTLDQLSEAFKQVDAGAHGSISLRGGDLSLLTRFPVQPGQDRLLGSRTITGDYLQAVRSNQSVTHFTARSVLDGSVRTYTMRRMIDPSFYILIGLSQEDYLRAWRKERLLAVITVVGLVGLSMGIASMGFRAQRRQETVNAMLEAQETKFRLLAENAEDVIWTSDLQGRLTYISPAVLAQRGYQPEELLAVSYQDRAAKAKGVEPMQRLLDRAKGLAPGAQPFKGEWMVVELPKKDGSMIHAEIRLRLIWEADGRLVGFQGVTRNITERVRMEAERETLIRDLQQALAEVKNLEGMLPICGHCKKIRDDRGYWNQLETYITAHTEATFTHGVCPDCVEAMRQEMRARKDRREQGR